jgi:hypothetical protein
MYSGQTSFAHLHHPVIAYLAGADLFPGSGMCMVTAGKKEGRGCCASVRLGGTFFELLRVLQFLLKLQKAAITTVIVV